MTEERAQLYARALILGNRRPVFEVAIGNKAELERVADALISLGCLVLRSKHRNLLIVHAPNKPLDAPTEGLELDEAIGSAV